MTSLAAMLQSPVGSNDSTIIGNGKTLPDITLGSLGSSFRSEDQENAPRPAHQPARSSKLNLISSPQTSDPASIHTPSPSHPVPSALVNLGSPSSPRRTDANPPGSHAPRRSRILRRASASSVSSADTEDKLHAAKYGGGGAGTDNESDAAGILSALSLNVTTTPGWKMGQAGVPRTARRGRQSTAAQGDGAPLTLRDQEQQLNAVKKEIFNLQLENHFLKERLANMAPDHIEAAVRENVKLKLEILNIGKEMKKLKKLLMQQDKDLSEAQRDREGYMGQNKGREGEMKELERLFREEREKRKAAEADLEEERERRLDGEEEMERMRAELDGAVRGSEVDELEERYNEAQDKLAAAQLDLERKEEEIVQLNDELDAKVRNQEKEIGEVEAEWRDELQEAKAQVEELKDVLEGREQDFKDIREVLEEKEEDLAAAAERIAELEAAQGDVHDKLEITLKDIEKDNADKEAELNAAGQEVERLNQSVYLLEERLEAVQEEMDSKVAHYEELVNALRESRDLNQKERNQAREDLQSVEDQRLRDKERHRLATADQEQIHARLQGELEAARAKVSGRDRDLATLQTALKDLEGERQKLGEEHTSDRFGLQFEVQRLQRELEAADDELARAKEDLGAIEMEKAQMRDKQRDLENRLSTERQGRLNLSDKLDAANKAVRQHERDATHLRERIGELEPMLTETQQERYAIQRQSDAQRQERSDLLLKAYKDVSRFLGQEDHQTPANFATFRDSLTGKLRAMVQVRTDFERKLKDTEARLGHEMGAIKKQLDQKWRALDNFEASVKKLELTRMQWRSKYAIKEGELEAAKARAAELTQQLSAARAGGSAESSTTLRSLTERADSAEKRARTLQNQLKALEQQLFELQDKNGRAQEKWEVRVKEYESRLRIAGEKIKTEKQGGRERAAQLEAQVQELERQVDQARRRNVRAEGVVASAAHLMGQDR